jgi:outer membrane immunogenic protein
MAMLLISQNESSIVALYIGAQMKFASLLLATTVAALAVSGAHAADLIVDTAPAVGIVETGSWDGPFVGVFGGYGSGTVSFDTTTDTIDPAGWLLGVNAGMNFTLSEGLVVGVVGDIAWSDMSGDYVNIGTATSTIDWLGSVRGRIGFDGGAFMPYLTGGLAFAHQTIDVNFPAADSDDQTHIGWTVGAGVEFAATEDISVDLLYRYSDYGDATYTLNGNDGDLGLTSHQLTVGLNFGF